MAHKLIEFSDVYIHVDSKSKNINEEEIAILRGLGCFVEKKYKIYWGSFNHVLAIIDLLKASIKKRYTYYHIISGEDLLVVQSKDFLDKFESNNKIYIACNKVDNNDIIKRYSYYYLFSKKNPFSKLWSRLNKLSLNVQSLLKVNRNWIGNEKSIYKGYVYCSLPHDAAVYVIDYCSANPNYLKDLSLCYIPEEFFFQTILMNSLFSKRIENNCLRYSIWEEKHGSIPGYLDINDLKKITSKDYIFARKVNLLYSYELIDCVGDSCYL